MAGEYVRWLARNEKPREKRELTPEEKRRNWWVYHRGYVLLALVCAVLLGDVIHDSIRSRRERPDYVVAYVGQRALPDEMAFCLEEGLASLGEDLSGSGDVRVELRQFVIPDSPEGNAASMTLVASIETTESIIFLLEDPEQFQSAYPILCRIDGSPMDEPADAPLYLSFADCPGLAPLLPQEGEARAMLAGLAVARRGIWNAQIDERIQGSLALWDRICGR